MLQRLVAWNYVPLPHGRASRPDSERPALTCPISCPQVMILTRIEDPEIALLAFAESEGKTSLAAKRMSDGRYFFVVHVCVFRRVLHLPTCTVAREFVLLLLVPFYGDCEHSCEDTTYYTACALIVARSGPYVRARKSSTSYRSGMPATYVALASHQQRSINGCWMLWCKLSGVCTTAANFPITKQNHSSRPENSDPALLHRATIQP